MFREMASETPNQEHSVASCVNEGGGGGGGGGWEHKVCFILF